VQTIVQNRSRRTVQFERRPSQRYARRQSQRQLREPHEGKDKAKGESQNGHVNKESTSVKPRSLPTDSTAEGRTSLSPPVTPTSRSTPSPVSSTHVEPSPAEDPLDNLIKSIAKENGTHAADVHSQPSSLELDVNVVPNNQSKYVSLPRPLPPDKLKCNILKAKVEEDIKKSSTNGGSEEATLGDFGIVPPVKKRENTQQNARTQNKESATFISVELNGSSNKPVSPAPAPKPKPKPRTLVQQNNAANTLHEERTWTNGVVKAKEKEKTIERRTVITTEI